MRCFTVLGPSQSGKTTLVSALGDQTGGSTETAFSDRMALRSFSFLGERWGAFDITGGADSLGHAGHALAASDSAVLCVSPDPEAAALAAPYLRLIEAAQVPCYLFINKMDGAAGRMRDTVAALQTYASHTIVLRQIPMRERGQVVGAVDLISERAWAYQDGRPSQLIALPEALRDREQEARTELLEHLADFDDALLEQLVEDKVPAPENIFALVSQMHQQNAFIPAFMGAAEVGHGVVRLMKSLRHESSGPGDIPDRLGLQARAIGIAAENRRHVGKSVLLRDLTGGLDQAARLAGSGIGGLMGLDGKPLAGAVEPGGLAVAVKSDHLYPGCGLTETGSARLPSWSRGLPPGLRRILAPVKERDEARLSSALAKLAAADPGLEVAHDAETGHLVGHLQGPMHLRRLLDTLESAFDIPVTAHPVPGSYRETVAARVEQHYRHRKQSGGAGQFADIVFLLEPRARGAGFAFAERVKGGAVPRAYIPSVQAGAAEALGKGPLGFPVVDVAVTLLDGKHHAVDSSDFAFKTAALMGVREALRAARPVLLQPVDLVEIHVPSVYSGQLVPLVSSLKGQVLGFEAHPAAKGWDVFRALLPAPAQEALFQSLGGLSHGTAWAETRFDHYKEIHGREAERVQAERAEAAA